MGKFEVFLGTKRMLCGFNQSLEIGTVWHNTISGQNINASLIKSTNHRIYMLVSTAFFLGRLTYSTETLLCEIGTEIKNFNQIKNFT